MGTSLIASLLKQGKDVRAIYNKTKLSISDPSSSIGIIVTALAFNPDVTAFDLTARSVEVEVLPIDDLFTSYGLA